MSENQLRKQLKEAPASFEDAFYEGAHRIRQYERRRRVCVTLGVVAILIGLIAAFPLLTTPKRDVVVVTEESAFKNAGMEDVVFVSPDDPFYHTMKDCGKCSADAVLMKLKTAAAFEKEPCPICAVENQQ